MIYGVVLRTQNSILFSFISGTAQIKINFNQCRRKITFRRFRNADECHKFYTYKINRNGDERNNIQKTSNDVFYAKFIQLLQQRLSGLDF